MPEARVWKVYPMPAQQENMFGGRGAPGNELNVLAFQKGCPAHITSGYVEEAPPHVPFIYFGMTRGRRSAYNLFQSKELAGKRAVSAFLEK